jgi:hypothetical protein
MKKIAALLFLAAILTACGANTPQPTKPTETSPAPTQTISLPDGITIDSVSLKTSGKSPDYSITTDTPVLQGDYPHRDEFNRKVSGFVKQETDAFKKNLADWTPVPDMAESSFILTFTSLPYSNRFASIQFKEEYYMAGAAHPGHQIVSLVYDLEKGQDVTLEQLFLPNSNYLQVISDYCKTELGKREIAFDAQQQGADPTKENYAAWNISTDGLVITFNEYQVAAYAAGPQTVVIPYASLKGIIDPQGPLADVAK